MQRNAQFEGWGVEGKRGIGKINFPSVKWILFKTIAENFSNYQEVWWWRIQRQIRSWRGGKKEQEKSQNQLDSAGNVKITGGILVLICEVSWNSIKKYMEDNFTKVVITEHKPMGISKWGLPKLNSKWDLFFFSYLYFWGCCFVLAVICKRKSWFWAYSHITKRQVSKEFRSHFFLGYVPNFQHLLVHLFQQMEPQVFGSRLLGTRRLQKPELSLAD